MDRRSFLTRSSVAILLAAGEWTGLSKAFARTSTSENNGLSDDNRKDKPMEYRNLRGLDVSAIGLGCLPMVGYYGGKYEKKEMIFALVWMLSRKPWIAPIPGATNPNHLDDFLGAATVRLSVWEMEEFDKEYARIDLMGHRADVFTESQIDK